MSTQTLKLIEDLLDVLVSGRWHARLERTRRSRRRVRRAVRVGEGFRVEYV